MAGPIRQLELLACIATQCPGALQKLLVFGRNSTPGLDARRRFTLEIVSSSQSEHTCIDSISRGKVYDLLNKNAVPRKSADLWVAIWFQTAALNGAANVRQSFRGYAVCFLVAHGLRPVCHRVLSPIIYKDRLLISQNAKLCISGLCLVRLILRLYSGGGKALQVHRDRPPGCVSYRQRNIPQHSKSARLASARLRRPC